jgi:hypothetical protein
MRVSYCLSLFGFSGVVCCGSFMVWLCLWLYVVGWLSHWVSLALFVSYVLVGSFTACFYGI